jgi:hypothetical protein
MTENICNKCNKDFKYESVLQRHLNKKKSCVKKTNHNNKPIENNQQIETNQNIKNDQHVEKKINTMYEVNNISEIYEIINNYEKNNKNEKNDKNINMLKEILKRMMNENISDENKNLVVGENKDEHEDDNNDKIESNVNNKPYNCTTCNKKFTYRQGLFIHKKNNRCKVKHARNQNVQQQRDDNMIENNLTINAENVVNVVNNNNITNNITNNQTIVVVNPFGFENLDHIKKDDVLKIGSNAKKIFDKLIRYIYKNKDNKNFFKHNMNKSLITYLSDELTIENINEEKFYIKLKNILVDNYIFLLYKHKNDLNFDEIVKCTFNLLKLEQLMKNEEEYKKEVDSIIYELCDTLLRDKDTHKKISGIISEFNTNIIAKDDFTKTIETNKDNKSKAIKEYVTKPETVDENTVNLYMIRQEAQADLLEYNERQENQEAKNRLLVEN